MPKKITLYELWDTVVVYEDDTRIVGEDKEEYWPGIISVTPRTVISDDDIRAMLMDQLKEEEYEK